MNNQKTIFNRTGLHLLIGDKKIVEIENIDMETASGRFKREFDEFGEDVLVWLPFEVAMKYEELIKQGKRIELVGHAWQQPNGNWYLTPQYALRGE